MGLLILSVALLAFLLTGAPMADEFKYPDRAKKYLPKAAAANKRHGLPPGTMESLLFQESGYKANVISGKKKSKSGAVGIAQIMPTFHPKAKPLDADASIDYAASYLAALTKRFGNLEDGLAAYNWGPGNLMRHGRKGRPPETRNYVSDVLGRIQKNRVVQEYGAIDAEKPRQSNIDKPLQEYGALEFR